jgi:hypothetical protein
MSRLANKARLKIVYQNDYFWHWRIQGGLFVVVDDGVICCRPYSSSNLQCFGRHIGYQLYSVSTDGSHGKPEQVPTEVSLYTHRFD